MKDVIRQIVDLCELDRQLHVVREQLQRYPAMLREMDQREKKAARAIEEITKRHKEAREGRRQAELDATGYREKIQKYKVQQGSVKTNRELEAIVHEIEGLESRIDAVETFGLELLEREEQAQLDLAEAEAAQRKLALNSKPSAPASPIRPNASAAKWPSSSTSRPTVPYACPRIFARCMCCSIRSIPGWPPCRSRTAPAAVAA
jgi:DNA repair exonuclease SbcCD ATPase subunit